MPNDDSSNRDQPHALPRPNFDALEGHLKRIAENVNKMLEVHGEVAGLRVAYEKVAAELSEIRLGINALTEAQHAHAATLQRHIADQVVHGCVAAGGNGIGGPSGQ